MDVFVAIFTGIGILVCLTLIVTVHEAGHFLVARWAGVEVEAFAVGWGKVLWAWKPRKTEYRICLLPLGGYCKMKGEQDLALALEQKTRSFEPSTGSLFAAQPWKRILISAAGPLFNLFFAFFLLFSLQVTGYPVVGEPARIQLASEVDGRTGTPGEAAGLRTGDIVRTVGTQNIITFTDLQEAIAASGPGAELWRIDRGGSSLQLTVEPRYDETEKRAIVGIYSDNEPVVGSVAPGSLAALAGFHTGDRILSVDGQPVTTGSSFFWRLNQNANKAQTVTVSRGGTSLDLLIVADSTIKKEGWGIQFLISTYRIPGLRADLAVWEGLRKTGQILSQMVDGLVQLFTGKVNPVQALSGPIGIVKVGTQATTMAFSQSSNLGWTTVVQFAVFLNLALFLMNLLPIPVLDGGSIVVSLVEGLRRKRLGLKAMVRYQQAGALLVLGLILFTTANDLGLFGKF
jgi:regulator of sigma E protease